MNIKNFHIDDRRCAKQTTIAIIENKGKYWVGSNWCENPQDKCPREGMQTGVGYDLCIDICGQKNHAEIDVCKKARENAKGGTLYLIGHTYCCDTCLNMMNKYGIKEVIIIGIDTLK